MKKLLTLALLLAIQGCATSQPDLYEWGHYEDLIWKEYSLSGNYSPEEHISKLEADFEVAKSRDKPVPPGYHAQLGMLYFQADKPDQALDSFAAEKSQFPESKLFMDRLIDTIKKRGQL